MDIYTNNKDMWKLEKKSRSKPYNNYNYNTQKKLIIYSNRVK